MMSTGCVLDGSMGGLTECQSLDVFEALSDLNPRFFPQKLRGFYTDHVLGAALFDLNGLPQRYFNRRSQGTQDWVQATFQALCLQSLLECGLQLKGPQHLSIRGKQWNILLVRQPNRYVGFLIQPEAPETVQHSLLDWAQAPAPSPQTIPESTPDPVQAPIAA